ncbi:pyruvate formate lyase family protein [Shigella flexneri]
MSIARWPGCAGLSVAADSCRLSSMLAKPIRDENGLAIDFEIEGDYPQYGNNDERVDSIACHLVERFTKKIKDFQPTETRSDAVHSDHHLQRGVRTRKLVTRRTDVAGTPSRQGKPDARPRS